MCQGPRWNNFELVDKCNLAVRHVVAIVVRGEFQTGARARIAEKALEDHGRGGVHWHVLIWLKDISKVCQTHIAAAHALKHDLDLNFFVNQVNTGGSAKRCQALSQTISQSIEKSHGLGHRVFHGRHLEVQEQNWKVRVKGRFNFAPCFEGNKRRLENCTLGPALP